MAELQTNHLWRYGPSWLKNSPTLIAPYGINAMPEKCSKELKTTEEKAHSLASTEVTPTTGRIIDCHKYSKFKRLVRVTGYVIRAVNVFKDKKTAQDSSLSTEKLSNGERRWTEETQNSLHDDNSFKTLKSQLKLFRDENGL